MSNKVHGFKASPVQSLRGFGRRGRQRFPRRLDIEEFDVTAQLHTVFLPDAPRLFVADHPAVAALARIGLPHPPATERISMKPTVFVALQIALKVAATVQIIGDSKLARAVIARASQPRSFCNRSLRFYEVTPERYSTNGCIGHR